MTSTRQAWWLVPLGIYCVGRCISALLLWWASRFQGATALSATDRPFDYFVYRPMPADPGYFPITTNWDGQWYEYIATEGYLTHATNASDIANNAWNFPPLFPYSVRLLMQLTGWDFAQAASVFSILIGAVATIMLFQLIRAQGGVKLATAITLLSSLYITSPLFQVAYSESLGLLFVVAALLLIQRRAYGWALIPVVLLCFTRLISPPLALVVVAHVCSRHRVGSHPLARAEWTRAVVLAGVAALGVGAWPMLSQQLRGGEQADRASAMVDRYRGGWFGELWFMSPELVIIPAVLVAIILVGARRAWLRCGVVVGAWAASYPLFLLASTPPLTGILRYFMFAFPLAILLVLGEARSPRMRWLTLICASTGMVLLQAWWIRYSFVVDLDNSRHIMP